MSSGALTSKGSFAIDGSTDIEGTAFSSLDGATDFASFTIGSSVYGLVTAKTDQAIQILKLVDTSIISSATYDVSSGTLVVTGEDLVAQSGTDNDIDISKLTLTGEGGNTYVLTSDDVELTSSTQFSITLNAADQLELSGLLNKDGTSSGGKGKDTLTGGEGSDTFKLSKGKDTIRDFSINDGDVIEAPNSLNLQFIQQGEDLQLKDNTNNIKTTILNINLDDFLTHQPNLI